MFLTKIFLQVVAMVADILIVACVVLCFYNSAVLGVLALVATHYAQKETGGWFYAWKKENIKKFWNSI